MSGRLPDFLIIGAMKCATSTLHEQLAVQDGVYMSTPKEPCFFSDDEQWNRGVSWYASLFSDAEAGDRCGESSTHYTKLPTYPATAQRIHDTLGGDVKLIYMMRHPVDRLVSQFIHEWSQGAIPANMTIDGMVEARPEFVQYGCYAHQLQPYFDLFGRERICPIFFERFVRNGEAELQHVGRFLDLPGTLQWKHDVEQRNVSSERIRRTPMRDAVLKNVAIRAVIRNVFPQSLRDHVKKRWSMQQRPELSAPVRAHLEELYDRDLAQLGQWLGLKLSCATFVDVACASEPSWAAMGVSS